jgi:hypothetical protein
MGGMTEFNEYFLGEEVGKRMGNGSADESWLGRAVRLKQAFTTADIFF